jgi:arabinogalactan oligomer/maltooligosaccharide transport system substrate-binding protein
MHRALSLLCLVAVLALAGCPRPTRKVAQQTLTLWHTYNPEETATLNRVLERVRAAHPGWRIEVTVIPFARAQNEFRRAAQRCEPGAPDVFRAELPWLAEFVSKRLIRAVPERLTPEAELLPQALRAARYRNARWALPVSLDCLALLYDRTLIRRAPETIDELVATARRATVDTAGRSPGQRGFDPARATRWGFYVRADAYWFLPFLWAQGGDLLDPESGKVFIDDARAVAALELYRDLIRVEKIAPPRPSPSNDYEDMMTRFAAGQLAMMVNGPWATSALLAQPRFRDGTRLGVAPFPRGRSADAPAPLSGHGLVVSSCARDPAAAWQLAQHLASAETQAEFARANSVLPALSAVYDREEVRRNTRVSSFRAALAASRARPQHPAIARIFDDFTPAVQAVLLGDAAPAEALAGVARAWRRLLGLPGAPASTPASRTAGPR